jgi:hypothetical protein
MSQPSNLYAEKIFSEHPTIMWALDDDADYISFVSESERAMTGWTIEDGSAYTSSTDINQPFEDSVLNLVEGDVPVLSTGSTTCISTNLVNFTDLDQDRNTFAVGAYFYSENPYLLSVEIGYEYTDTTTSQIIQDLKLFETSVFQAWGFVSETFEIPDENTTLRLVIKFNYEDGGASSSDYQFYVNGFSLGQWCENVHAVSLGQETIPLPSSIALTGLDCMVADPYGFAGDNAYYIVKDGGLKAYNAGIPMVYGATGSTNLLPNNNDPSFIFPGKGFLNKAGQYKEYTVEFWIKINSNTSDPLKIFGPIGSTDGLYVESGFLTLVIGEKFASYFISEWYRPMLIDIRVIRNSATVLINGAEVISLDIDTDNLLLPDILDQNGKEQDWLGFYCYDSVSPIEIDGIAIYSYSVAINLAKRRLVYGQGVLSPETINSAYGGKQAFIDYPFAKYTVNYSYPNSANWAQGSFDNLTTNSNSLSTPDYSLPNIFLDTKTLNELYADNKAIQDPLDYKFITFRPDNSWDSDQCYFDFERFNLLSDQTSAFYGVFSSEDLLSEEVLLKIYNQINGNYFKIVKDADEIKYIFYYDGEIDEVYTTVPIISDEKFAVGLQISTFVNYYGGNLATFFNTQSGLKLYVGGDEIASNQFTGKIYSFGLSTPANAAKISSNFTQEGIAMIDDSTVSGYVEPVNAIELLEHTASYTLIAVEAYDSYFLDIGVSGYWQDYLPLSYFGKYVKNESGRSYYDLDFLQFNIGYPSPTKLAEYEDLGSWTYQELLETYKYPIQRTYADLDNSLYTGWDDYLDMKTRSVKYYEYDTENAAVRSYITFQYIQDGANLPLGDFTTTVPAREGLIIDMDNYSDWINTKFEVVDNTLIYPSQTVDFNTLAIVYNLEFNVRGILSKSFNLSSLEFASQALNSDGFNPIGTRFGSDLFPYTQAGLYYDYKTKNPFSIYKRSTPYLYLNRTSGIEVRGDFSQSITRGISLPINTSAVQLFQVGAMQVWMRSELDVFPLSPVEVFEINHVSDTVKFYIQALDSSGKRAKIFAKSLLTGETYNGLTYFWNGSLVREPVISLKEWGVLGISFAQPLDYSYYVGRINLTGPLVFNNIAYYEITSLQQVQTQTLRPWLDVKSKLELLFDWAYWKNSSTWNGVLVISESSIYGVSPEEIYKSYAGTNKIIIDDDNGLTVDADKLKIYSDIRTTTRVGTPV